MDGVQRAQAQLARERESNLVFENMITERISAIDLEIMQLEARRDALKLALDDFASAKAAQ